MNTFEAQDASIKIADSAGEGDEVIELQNYNEQNIQWAKDSCLRFCYEKCPALL